MGLDSIFISYSQKDSKWLAEIKKHLSILEHNYQLVIWDDTKIKVGSDWKIEIEHSIKKCRVAILLVSNNFLASEFIVKQELPKILNASRHEGVIVFNIIIDTCAFHLTDLEAYQSLNNPKYPLEELKTADRKRVLVGLTTELVDVIQKQNSLIYGTDKLTSGDEATYFDIILVLADLVRNGAKTITDIQNATLIRRKIVVAVLRKLQDQLYVTKFQEQDQKKKPATLWKVSEIGCSKYNDFESVYSKILHPNS